MQFDGIAIDPQVMLGKPCVKGTRITVELIISKLATGATIGHLLEGYPRLNKTDIEAAINYHKHSIQH